jgi:hypothetical protein
LCGEESVYFVRVYYHVRVDILKDVSFLSREKQDVGPNSRILFFFVVVIVVNNFFFFFFFSCCSSSSCERQDQSEHQQ